MDLDKQRLALGIAYINELRTCDISECISIVRSWLDNLYSTWIDIKDNGEVVGFIIINRPPNTAQGFNWYIQEAYIIPKRRRKGLMRETLKKLFRLYLGKYCFYILEGNQRAFSYWHKTIPELGGVWIENACGLKKNDLVFYGFEV